MTEEDANTAEGKGRVMVIEDDQEILKINTGILMEAGYEVIPVYADGSNRAFMEFQESLDSLDGLVTDLRMPGVNGVEFAKFARDKGIPVIAVSAYLSEYTEERLSRSGIVCSIEKPFRPQELEEKAEEFFAGA